MVLKTIVISIPSLELKLAPTKTGISINLNKGENLRVMEFMEDLNKATNFTKVYNRRNMDTVMLESYLAQVSNDDKDKKMRYFDTPLNSLNST